MKPIGFDNTMLSILLNPASKLPIDPRTGAPLECAKSRAMARVAALSKERRKIIIPTPVCAEILTVIGPEAQQYLELVAQNRHFEIASFDSRCAVELAILNRTTFNKDDKKNSLEPYQRLKFDRQIIAICKVAGVEDLYTDDNGLASRALICGINVIRSWDLPAPASAAQGKLPFAKHDPLPEAT